MKYILAALLWISFSFVSAQSTSPLPANIPANIDPASIKPSDVPASDELRKLGATEEQIKQAEDFKNADKKA